MVYCSRMVASHYNCTGLTLLCRAAFSPLAIVRYHHTLRQDSLHLSNIATVKDAYPLPRIDDALDMVAVKQWFSTLDLASGYWQVSLSQEARIKTAVATHSGLFQFKVMPFGLCNAPATFERLMERDCNGRTV